MPPDAPPPLVVVSVLNWNTADSTLHCLQALSRLQDANWRIVLVDNASIDDSVAQIQARHPQLTILRSAQNLGFAGGHALALAQARQWNADALWLLNSDAQVQPCTLRALVWAWLQHGLAVYGGLPLDRSGAGDPVVNFPARYLDPQMRLRPFARDPVLRCDASWSQRPAFAVAAVPGSCMLLPLALIDQHGWMDPRWFLYCEEVDYCLRLRDAGVASFLVPQAQFAHAGGGSHHARPHVSDCIGYYQARNEIALFRRHAGRMAAGVVAFKKLARAAWTCLWCPRRAGLIGRGVLDAVLGRSGQRESPDAALRHDLQRSKTGSSTDPV